MHLYHIDSLTGPEELYAWCDSFDNAWRWAMLTDTFKNTNLGDIRVRRLFKNHEISRFNKRINPAAPFEITAERAV